MGDSPQRQNEVNQDSNEPYEVQTESESENQGPQYQEAQEKSMQRRQQRQQPQQQYQQPPQPPPPQQVQQPQYNTNQGQRTGAIRESRIKDRPQPKETRDSSLKIKVELDLEAEVELYARVKGDVTVGLM